MNSAGGRGRHWRTTAAAWFATPRTRRTAGWPPSPIRPAPGSTCRRW